MLCHKYITIYNHPLLDLIYLHLSSHKIKKNIPNNAGYETLKNLHCKDMYMEHFNKIITS
jgi:hypothetical protein